LPSSWFSGPGLERRSLGGKVEGGLFFAGLAPRFGSGIVFLPRAGFSRGQSVGEYKAHSDAYAQDAEQEIRNRCVILPPLDMAECIQEVVKAANEDQRAERDLVAQKDAARWGLGTLIISAFGGAIAIIGTALVWKTLEATRNAVKEASEATKAAQEAVTVTRDIGLKQLRPWLLAGGVQFEIFNWSLDDRGPVQQLTFHVPWVNRGQTPAVKAIIGAIYCAIPRGALLPPFRSVQVSGTLTIGPGLDGGSDTFPVAEPDANAFREGRADLAVFSRADYAEAFQPGSSHFTEVTYRCRYRGEVEDEQGRPIPNIVVLIEGPQNAAT
jgi:hypothetical protein